MRSLLQLFLVLVLAPLAFAELEDFKAPDEMIDGWYHRHEHESWIHKGADPAIIAAILARIERAEGARTDPELVDTISAYGPGHWVYEWSTEGERAMSRAFAQRGDKQAAYQRYREALAYFTIASWPHLGAVDDTDALARARDAYLAASRYVPGKVSHVTIPAGDTQAKGYLHLPKGRGPFPLLIYTYGSDVTKEDGLGFFVHELGPAGIALLTVDLPGIGEASHIPLQQGSDLMLTGARLFARSVKQVAQDQVFVAGASFGGNAAARYFFTHEPGSTAGVVSMCGPLHRPFVAPPEVYDQLPALTIDGVKARLGIAGASNVKLSQVAPAVSLKVQGFGGTKVATPLLIFTTNRDPVAPLADLALLEDAAEHSERLVIDTVGHCPPRWVRQPVVRRWIQDQIRSGAD